MRFLSVCLAILFLVEAFPSSALAGRDEEGWQVTKINHDSPSTCACSRQSEIILRYNPGFSGGVFCGYYSKHCFSYKRNDSEFAMLALSARSLCSQVISRKASKFPQAFKLAIAFGPGGPSRDYLFRVSSMPGIFSEQWSGRDGNPLLTLSADYSSEEDHRDGLIEIIQWVHKMAPLPLEFFNFLRVSFGIDAEDPQLGFREWLMGVFRASFSRYLSGVGEYQCKSDHGSGRGWPRLKCTCPTEAELRAFLAGILGQMRDPQLRAEFVYEAAGMIETRGYLPRLLATYLSLLRETAARLENRFYQQAQGRLAMHLFGVDLGEALQHARLAGDGFDRETLQRLATVLKDREAGGGGGSYGATVTSKVASGVASDGPRVVPSEDQLQEVQERLRCAEISAPEGAGSPDR